MRTINAGAAGPRAASLHDSFSCTMYKVPLASALEAQHMLDGDRMAGSAVDCIVILGGAVRLV